eukprot:CAMPEP_0197248334 /NCGR_PEP_ID=MMETSP1429-20130617/37773_1 /TAXON_ID=49237 /ORGANISM="Chaetoceros  sp., Strain UNC1202" /LENGTH=165 /DNA_ID=CAMNT_0042709509 /DNA_START=27 /DNA_END=524 /DNA_ORIENTATION=-
MPSTSHYSLATRLSNRKIEESNTEPAGLPLINMRTYLNHGPVKEHAAICSDMAPTQFEKRVGFNTKEEDRCKTTEERPHNEHTARRRRFQRRNSATAAMLLATLENMNGDRIPLPPVSPDGGMASTIHVVNRISRVGYDTASHHEIKRDLEDQESEMRSSKRRKV